MPLQTVRTRLLDGATGTGDGPVFQAVQPFLYCALQLEITGAPTAVKVSLKGLIDGTTYDTLAVLDTAAGYASGEIVALTMPVGVRNLKCSLDTLTGGTAPSVNAYFVGGQ
jgi:hypothetical protein